MKLIVYYIDGKSIRCFVRSIEAGHDFAHGDGDHVKDYEILDDNGCIMYSTRSISGLPDLNGFMRKWHKERRDQRQIKKGPP